MIIAGIFLVFILLFFTTARKTYKRMSEYNSLLASEWKKVYATYQTRNLLISDFLNLAKAYTNSSSHCVDSLKYKYTELINDQVDSSEFNPGVISHFEKKQSKFSHILTKLVKTIENKKLINNRPRFVLVQNQIENAEIKSSLSRKEFNKLAKEYNNFINKFPRSVYASFFDFHNIPQIKEPAFTNSTPSFDTACEK